ncbi:MULTISPECIES: hypothetical protein [unclassified Schlesneria]|uniref:hypothetical protein n=1 Tax=unclassified Schlesneria TaxID=2762017 RepID=UPI002F1F3D74
MKTLFIQLACAHLVAVGLILSLSSTASAQALRGGEVRFPAVISGEERTSQTELWAMDVYLKPMRLIPVELTDPITGNKKLEYVWYIVYRAFPHKFEELTGDNAPVNVLDPPVAPQLFIPEFTLVVTDNDRKEVFPDQVIPEALAAINKREKGRYKSAVDVVGPIPDASQTDGSDQYAIEGVAMWRGIDPDADRYTVFMTGFTNSIRKVEGPGGKPIIQTKTIMQKYWRRGDRYDQREPEISLDGDMQWIYR